jgi:hypothetical protein
MADNVGYTPGTGAQIAADEIAGVLYQRAKLTFGIDGEAADVSAINPLPVSVTGTQPISAASLPLPSGASTESTLAAIKVVADQINADIDALNAKTISANTDSVTLVDVFGALRSLQQTLGRLSYDATSQLRVAPANISTVSTLTTLTTMTTGYMSFGDMTKASTVQLESYNVAANTIGRNFTRT